MPVQLVLCLWAEAQAQPLVQKTRRESVTYGCDFVIDVSTKPQVHRIKPQVIELL